MSNEAGKRAAGRAAAELIHEGMLVGLGTGSTAFYFIERLIERCREGLKIKAVASSKASYEQAKKGKIPLIDIELVTNLDITIDGADEVDPKKRLIKGGGGALVREKIVASMSREMVVIVDETKLVPHLGRHPLPVEIVPFAYKATLYKLEKLGYKGILRTNNQGHLYVTENHNYIFDLKFDTPCQQPEQEQEKIRNVPGVVDTGFFFHLAGRVLIGFNDGKTIIR